MKKCKLYSLATVAVLASISFFALPGQANAVAAGCTNPGLTVARCSRDALKAYCKTVRLNGVVCCVRKSRRTGHANHLERYTCRTANLPRRNAAADIISDDSLDETLGITIDVSRD